MLSKCHVKNISSCKCQFLEFFVEFHNPPLSHLDFLPFYYIKNILEGQIKKKNRPEKRKGMKETFHHSFGNATFCILSFKISYSEVRGKIVKESLELLLAIETLTSLPKA